MDRRIETKAWTARRIVAAVLVLGLAAGVAALLLYLSTPRMRVERDKLIISTVRRGAFREGEPPALLLDRGAFFRTTGGHWVWLVDEAGETAVRRQVRLGRQSPEFHEVLSGLAEGDRVITSTYDHLEGAEELVLTH
jgi:hypothetical protein